jgi:hypothetical protein
MYTVSTSFTEIQNFSFLSVDPIVYRKPIIDTTTQIQGALTLYYKLIIKRSV